MIQRSYSRLWSGYESDEEAKKARSADAKLFRKEGHTVRLYTLRDQLKKYDGFGIPNGGVCNVYCLDIDA